MTQTSPSGRASAWLDHFGAALGRHDAAATAALGAADAAALPPPRAADTNLLAEACFDALEVLLLPPTCCAASAPAVAVTRRWL